MPDDDKTRLPDESQGSNLLTPGQSFGQYKVVRLLGRGGMGEVYEVEHSVLHKQYALKVIRLEVLNRPTVAERFRREAQVMSHLEHTHIVAVDEFGEIEGHTWLRMPLLGDYVDASGRRLQSLEEVMRGDCVLPEAEVRKYLEQILSALDYAHGKGAVHRDIKPSNILFDKDGELKIADFGLVHMAGEEWVHSQVQLTVAQSMAQPADPNATHLEDDASDTGQAGTSTQALLGTFEYMAPEQKRGGPADARSDLYAVGLMAFRMLTGESAPGFKGPSRINPELSTDWDEWVERAMETSPESRFASAAAMSAALPKVGELHVEATGGDTTTDTDNKMGSHSGNPPEAELTEVVVPREESNEVPGGEKGRRSFLWPVVLLIFLLLGAGAGAYFLGIVPTGILRQTDLAQVSSETTPELGRDWDLQFGGVEVLKLKWIAPGSFQMGSHDGESDEKPVHRVRLSRGYWLGSTEVTQGQWHSVMGINPSKFEGSKLPVEKVSWDEAMQFCRKLTDRERAAGRLPAGMAYTLPTEAQWEYACRAGTTGAYEGDLDAMGWYNKNSSSKTHPVATKRANAWGLYDMHGNVWEWCSDWYGEYPGGNVVDPSGASSGWFRVYRGGSWGDLASFCRSALRNRGDTGYRSYILGFRLALRFNQ